MGDDSVVSQGFSVEERERYFFAAAERLDLEGIVAKRKADPYPLETVWYKVKNQANTQAEVAGTSSSDGTLSVFAQGYSAPPYSSVLFFEPCGPAA